MVARRSVTVAAGVSAVFLASSTAFAISNGVFGASRAERVGTFRPIEARLGRPPGPSSTRRRRTAISGGAASAEETPTADDGDDDDRAAAGKRVGQHLAHRCCDCGADDPQHRKLRPGRGSPR